MDTQSFVYSLNANQPTPMVAASPKDPIAAGEASSSINGMMEHRVICVGPTLDVESYAQFAPVLQWTPNGRCEIIIDCATLKLVSTAGLRLFLSVDAHARKHFGHAKIINCNDDVARVLQTATDFTTRFRMPFERAATK